ncbi:flagellin [Parvularcula oceani]|uniref:flagellin N-terminal helical domain-containing protein n=1 Tax=Parvularcula oceani TaxID=1247963 RepID=UPI0004E14855|nr:flagellin [Parvularcula oceani]
MTSINVNQGALIALSTLQDVNSDLSRVSNEISTGKRINTAKDNAAIWSIAETMNSDIMAFETVSESLSLGSATVGVARSAAESIVDMMKEIKSLATTAAGEGADRTKLSTEIGNLVTQINDITASAQFNGVNLIASGAADVTILSSLNRSGATVTPGSITITAQDLSALGSATYDVSDQATAQTTLATIETNLVSAIDAAAAFGSTQNRIDIQSDFIGSLVDNMEIGVGALVDTNMEEASADLKALQVQQQLGIQSLSIANAAPQSVLSLFR